MKTNTALKALNFEELAQANGGSAFTEWLSGAWDWFTGGGNNDGKGKIGNGNPNMSYPL